MLKTFMVRLSSQWALWGRAYSAASYMENCCKTLLCMRALLIPQLLIMPERTVGADETCRRAGCS